jgi:photosystem II stability/assembly factor-like uncharacterized protein
MGSGVARASLIKDSEWTVETVLQGLDIRCLAPDPLDSGVVYAGTQGGGVLRSEDRGRTWKPAGMQGRVVKSLAVSPHEPGVIFAGTKPACIFVSRDGGATWSELEGFRRIPFRWWWFTPAETPNQAYVQAIAMSPVDPKVIMAGIEFGAVVRSDDGGESWSAHIPGTMRDCHQLMFHRSDGDWVYQAGGTGCGAAFSRDGGRTWSKAGSGLVKHYGVACAADPAEPGTWYVSVAPGPAKAYGEQAEAYLYRSEPGGWKPIGWEGHPMRQMPLSLVTDPEEQGHLYAGLLNGDIWHSPDHGRAWRKMPFNLGAVWRTLVVLGR